ncbi:hypothetical protein CGZ77_00675 [Neisseria sp. KEM232]|uniref:hypothetical protein n=1 Tax=Neisseria sp. KEM232 TaxID=655307 RepID=UPI000B8BF9A9|nr:hypothetical protein [Neisseria sp. KEM232]ASP16384.1 hypothetical protein CGZ77_00675 [Neisseria sp. KEM232]
MGNTPNINAFRGQVLQNRTCTTSATTVAGGVFGVLDAMCLADGRAMRGSLKPWLYVLLLPHIATLLLLMLFTLPAAMQHSGFALEILLSPVLLWLMAGTIGWFAYLPHVAEWPSLIAPTAMVLLIIAVCLLSGCHKRHHHSGKRMISLAVWLWFAYGFVLLACSISSSHQAV